MVKLSLFDRIQSAIIRPSVRSQWEDPSFVVRSIASNLENVINQRMGCIIVDPGLGMPDWTDFSTSFHDSFEKKRTNVLKRALLKIIHKCEPRLEKVEVNLLIDKIVHSIAFDIKANLKTHNKTVAFNHVINNNSTFRTSGWIID